MDLRERLRGVPPEPVVAVTVAAHVFSVMLGQTKVFSLLHLGWRLRWMTLLALVAVAGLALLRSGRVSRPLAAPLLAAAALVAIALVSATWSAFPEFGGRRAISFAALLAAVGALAAARVVYPVAAGVLLGAAAVAFAGLVVLVVDSSTAIERATAQYPARYNGLGGNPNAAAALEAVALPLALWLALSRERRLRVAGWAAVAVFAGSIVASGSRGGLLAATAGSTAFMLLQGGGATRRLVLAALVVAVGAAGALAAQIPDPDPNAKPAPLPSDRQPPPPPVPPNEFDVQQSRPLAEEVGLPDGPEPFRRTLFGAAGRGAALEGAIEQVLDRPLLGFGFGTEEKVFVERYHVFNAARPENAYIGAALQIGLIGLTALLSLLASLLASARAAFAAERLLAAGLVGAVTAGLVLGISQSFVFSVGSSVTSSFWLCAFMLPALAALADRAQPR